MDRPGEVVDLGGEGGLERRRRERLLDQLPENVLNHLTQRSHFVLDWACGRGEGVELLGKRFPRSQVAGLNFTAAAVEQARRQYPAGEFVLAADGQPPQRSDVVFCVHVLQCFPTPLEQLRQMLATCRGLCILLVPLNEWPLAEGHRSQFREEAFPENLGNFEVIVRQVLEAKPEKGLGRELLVVYASAQYRRHQDGSGIAEAEQNRVEDFYTSLGEPRKAEATQSLHAEFTPLIEELLGPRSRILEVGCSTALPSRALARLGKYDVQVLDQSCQTLGHVRRLFAQEGLCAETCLGDVRTPGEQHYDLVFNANLLEQHTLDRQLDVLRGMASRSRRYVLVLVPNRLCYWYWLRRLRAAKEGNWLAGKECPMADLSVTFEKAGLHFLGHAFLGAAWTEDLLASFEGLDEGLRQDVLAIHRSPLLDPQLRCYLVAALATVGPVPDRLSAAWRTSGVREDFRTAELSAALADALALRLAAEARVRQVETRAQALAEELSTARAENTKYREFTASSMWWLATLLQKSRTILAPDKSLRSVAVTRLYRAARRTVDVVGRVRQLTKGPPEELPALIRRCQNGPRPIIFPPSMRWTATLFQRPHHLAREFARLGHPVIFDVNATTEPLKGFKEIEPNLFLYKGDPRHLRRLPRPVLWTFTYNFRQVDKYPQDASSVYDWIDDLTVFDGDQEMLRRQHERGLREATLVTSVARRLHEEAVTVRPDAIYLPNAAGYEHFATPAAPASDPELKRFLKDGGPVAGYYGALASWFDYALLKAVADRRPEWRFVLIGPDYDGSIRKQPLLDCSNVIWLGSRDYATLPGYLAYFDVAMIPFLINDITQATSPLKLYEYFAAGKPVLTTPMPECMSYPQVHIVRWAEDFSAALDDGLAESRSEEFRQRIRAVGAANSWEARARLIAGHFAPRVEEHRRAA